MRRSNLPTARSSTRVCPAIGCRASATCPSWKRCCSTARTLIYEKAVLAVLLAFAVILAAPPVQGQMEMRYKFKEGEKLPYVIDQKAKNITNIGGQTVETQTVQTVDYTMNVLSVDKDGK